VSPRALAASSAVAAALAVAAGAFGAHALAGRLDARGLELWQTGDRYLAYAALGGLAMSALPAAGRRAGRAAIVAVLAGGLLFAATLFALALGAPRLLGAATPFGGLAMIVGFTSYAFAVARDRAG